MCWYCSKLIRYIRELNSDSTCSSAIAEHCFLMRKVLTWSQWNHKVMQFNKHPGSAKFWSLEPDCLGSKYRTTTEQCGRGQVTLPHRGSVFHLQYSDHSSTCLTGLLWQYAEHRQVPYLNCTDAHTAETPQRGRTGFVFAVCFDEFTVKWKDRTNNTCQKGTQRKNSRLSTMRIQMHEQFLVGSLSRNVAKGNNVLKEKGSSPDKKKEYKL